MTKLVFRSGVRSQTNGRASLRKRELEVVIRAMLRLPGCRAEESADHSRQTSFRIKYGDDMEKMELTCAKTADLPIFESQGSRSEPGDSRRTETTGSSSKSGGFTSNSRPTKGILGCRYQVSERTSPWQTRVGPSCTGSDPVHWTLSPEVFCRQCTRVH